LSTAISDIFNAFTARLNTMSGLPAVAWENTVYVPTKGTPFIRPTLLPADTAGATMTTDKYSGIFQIDVYEPAGAGWSAMVALLDAIADHFKPVTELTVNTTTVRCLTVSDWYHGIVEIRYLSTTTKR